MTSIDVRFFAGAAQAFGTSQATVELPDGALLGDLLNALRSGAVASAGESAGTVLGRCSFLVNKVSTKDEATPLADGIRVDVLPPFAGG